jgi:hypothetical protein
MGPTACSQGRGGAAALERARRTRSWHLHGGLRQRGRAGTSGFKRRLPRSHTPCAQPSALRSARCWCTAMTLRSHSRLTRMSLPSLLRAEWPLRAGTLHQQQIGDVVGREEADE